MAKTTKKTNIFLFIPLILILSVVLDIFLGFITVKLDLQQFNGTNLYVLPFISAVSAGVISYLSMKRGQKDKVIFSIAIFIMAFLIAYPLIPVTGALVSISDACAKQAPHPCLL